MIFEVGNGQKLLITIYGLRAELPLIRKDSVCRSISKDLWGVYTPSLSTSALLFGAKEDCEAAIEKYVDVQPNFSGASVEVQGEVFQGGE